MSALAFALGVVVGWWAGARRSRVRVDFRRDHEPAVDLDWREPPEDYGLGADWLTEHRSDGQTLRWRVTTEPPTLSPIMQTSFNGGSPDGS